jgi:hypothetical protein
MCLVIEICGYLSEKMMDYLAITILRVMVLWRDCKVYVTVSGARNVAPPQYLLAGYAV